VDVILQGVVGSTAYGLATPTSDIDRLGVYVAPTEAILGLNGANAADNSIVRTEPDLTLHEVGKYLSLALKGNPTILELLYLEEYDVCGYRNPLVECRDQFLSKKLAKTYGGYVMQQVKRLENRNAEGKAGFSSDLGKRTAKHGRHCYRLLTQGQQLLTEKRITIKLDEHQRRACFDAGELAERSPERFREYIERKMELFDLAAEKSTLPDHPDYTATDWLLKSIRMDHWGYELPVPWSMHIGEDEE